MGFICVHIAQRVCIIGYCPCILRRTGRKAMVKGRGGGGQGGLVAAAPKSAAPYSSGEPFGRHS